ncbi:hypothetical protein D0T49_03040 [Paludibacter sp. 221]|nr:hypothetical protein [Paludibacter sp. 221]
MHHSVKTVLFFGLVFIFTTSHSVKSQDIPQHISYTRIYDFIDELANDGYFELNSAIKPYSRKFICDQLLKTQEQKDKLNNRQRKELEFFLNEYALERDTFPNGWPHSPWANKKVRATLIQPAVYYRDNIFRARITPLLGMHVTHNENGNIIKRWYGAEFQGMFGKNLSVWGSLRDISMNGALISKPNYLNDQPGYQYKEASYGGDYSDSRGGIKYGWNWGSFGLVKDNIVWGDNYHGANILSGRAPSFPMVTLNLKPARWFELNYFHGWLVSNQLDSTEYYIENEITKYYRPANKFMAANMFTISPVRNLHISAGNAIIYAENNVQAAYFIPIAFYKSIDHTLTKGVRTENQNSMMFLNISSRNIKHLHLYASVFVDEFSAKRLKSDNPQQNPISYKLGGKLSNFPIQNISLTGEFTRTNIINYKHSIPTLTWASNSYNLGHYLGDNSQEFYAELRYKPIRGLDLKLSFMDARHGKEYDYIRKGTWSGDNASILDIISQPSLGKVIWSNQTFAFNAVYEVFNNAYAILNVEHSNIQGFDSGEDAVFGEKKMTAQEALDYFTPKYLQGKNTTITVGFSFGF